MKMWLRFVFLTTTFLVFFAFQETQCCRRRRSCSAQSCRVSSWSRWSSCSRTCGSSGTQKRTRHKTRNEYCGGSCHYSFSETRACNRRCCPVSCSVSSWSRWSTCVGCGSSTQRSFRRIISSAACGGTACPSSLQRSQSCYTGRYVVLIRCMTSYENSKF